MSDKQVHRTLTCERCPMPTRLAALLVSADAIKFAMTLGCCGTNNDVDIITITSVGHTSQLDKLLPMDSHFCFLSLKTI